MKGKPFLTRLACAAAGIAFVWRHERSFRTQACLALAAALAAAILRLQAMGWAVLALTIGLVLVTEAVNTSIETLIDHLHPARHPAIKAVKDMTAGAVLIASLLAVAVGICLAIAAL